VKKRSKPPEVVSVHFCDGVSPTLRNVWTTPRGTYTDRARLDRGPRAVEEVLLAAAHQDEQLVLGEVAVRRRAAARWRGGEAERERAARLGVAELEDHLVAEGGDGAARVGRDDAGLRGRRGGERREGGGDSGRDHGDTWEWQGGGARRRAAGAVRRRGNRAAPHIAPCFVRPGASGSRCGRACDRAALSDRGRR
jgi:hypothetical protein